MNEQENEARQPGQPEELQVLEHDGRAASVPEGDLVVDLTGIRKLDLISLSILLTAQQQAEQEDRGVWLAGVPMEVWKALNAMGLGSFFKVFPVSGAISV